MPASNLGGLGRRDLLLGLAAAGALSALGAPARAQATGQAQDLVTSLTGELTQLVNSGRGDSQMYQGFEDILSKYADLTAIGASVLGPPWRAASPAQKQAFVKAFSHYLSRRYGKQFRDYKNAQIKVTGAKDGGRVGVLVNSQVLRPGQETVNVDWQISGQSGSLKVVNLVIEGVSMLASERANMGSMLDAAGGNLDKLVAQLNATT
ncbi:MAG: ABC transporter substrate-binding protein [Amaricoccus sp.]|uniref:MlaC/ttg2D family ABC transporter substrate-binding protein n=1 Tax=Amaricoccus sp. TaxID=1872485 RepID=UPI0039E4606D